MLESRKILKGWCDIAADPQLQRVARESHLRLVHHNLPTRVRQRRSSGYLKRPRLSLASIARYRRVDRYVAGAVLRATLGRS